MKVEFAKGGKPEYPEENPGLSQGLDPRSEVRGTTGDCYTNLTHLYAKIVQIVSIVVKICGNLKFKKVYVDLKDICLKFHTFQKILQFQNEFFPVFQTVSKHCIYLLTPSPQTSPAHPPPTYFSSPYPLPKKQSDQFTSSLDATSEVCFISNGGNEGAG